MKRVRFPKFAFCVAVYSLLSLTGCNSDVPPATANVDIQPDDSKTIASTEKKEPDNRSAETEVTPPVNTTDDLKQFFGSWRSVRIEEKGRVTPNSEGAKVVLSEPAMSIGGVDYKYQIKADSRPIAINFSSPTDSVPYQGILQLNDGKLYLCYSTRKENPRPTEFKTNESDGNLLFVLERAAELSSGEATLSPELAEAIERAIANLESNNIEAYVTDILAPDELVAVKASGWDKTLDFVTKQRDKTLVTLKALKNIAPKLEQESTRAVFDLSKVSIEGGVGLPKMAFRKVEGKWYLTNR